jgi:hypothetical protein
MDTVLAWIWPALCRDPEGKGLHTRLTRSLEDGQSSEQYDEDGGKACLTLQIPLRRCSDVGKSNPRGPHGVGIAAGFSD